MNRSLRQRSFFNILIIKPSSLGDVVRCLPILSGLHRRFPGARISWMIRPDCADLLKSSPYLNDIIDFDRYRFGRAGRSTQASWELIKFLNSLRSKNFDLVLDLQGLFRSGFIGLCTGATIRLGFAHAREFSPVFYTHRVAIPHRAEHVVDSYWRFASYLGFGEQKKSFDLPIDSDAEKTAKTLLSYSGLPSKRPFAVLLIGGTKSAKCWPPARFAALAQALKKHYHIASVLLGAGPVENTAAQKLMQIAQKNAKIVNLVDKTSLLQAIALIKNARLVVGNDSGPLHIAAALSVPLVGLYGPTDPVVVGPYGQNDGIVRAGPAQLENRRYSQNPEHRIENITVEQVIRVVERKIDASVKSLARLR